MNEPYEATETHVERLLGRAVNSFDLPDGLVERLDSALLHASTMSSAHHGGGLHRETHQHTYLLTDSSVLILWELVHNSSRDGSQLHELYAEAEDAQLAESRLSHPCGPKAPRLSTAPGLSTAPATHPHDRRPDRFDPSDPSDPSTPPTQPDLSELSELSELSDPALLSEASDLSLDDPSGTLPADLEAGRMSDPESDFALLSNLLTAPPAALPRRRPYALDNSADHARRLLRRAENTDRPGEETSRLMRDAFGHHISQVFGRQCQVAGREADFTLYEHAFLLTDGTETSLWEVEHTATPDGRHMCEVYGTEHTAREAMESRARVR